jgi:predicted GIY-YIG superfamily endonuclease
MLSSLFGFLKQSLWGSTPLKVFDPCAEAHARALAQTPPGSPTAKSTTHSPKVDEIIYVLALENNKYYVGKTCNLARRLDEHNNGNGAAWTKLYKPMKCLVTHVSSSRFDESAVTKEWMLTKGIDNVRGGAYSQVHLSKTTQSCLLQELWDAEDKCRKCGSSSHFAALCNAKGGVGGGDDVEARPVKRARYGKKWTPEEEAEILHQITENVSLDQIALEHDRSAGGIQWRLRKIGIDIMENEKITAEEAAERVRLPVAMLLTNKYRRQSK